MNIHINYYSNNLDDILSTDRTLYKTVKTIQEYTDSKGRLRKRTVSKREGTTQRYFYEKNHLGSIVKITDSLGRAIEEYTYDVYGRAFINKDLYDRVKRGELGEALLASQELEDEEVNELATNSEENLLIQNTLWVQYNGRGILNNTILYTGREYDREIGLYYLRARYYSADLGRFVSRDPIGIADDINLYAYVGNSPVMYTDPSGEVKKLFSGLFYSNEEIIDYVNNKRFLSQAKIEMLIRESDSFAIVGNVPFSHESSTSSHILKAHTEIIFYKNGKGIFGLGSGPIYGWHLYNRNSSVEIIDKYGTIIGEKKNDVKGCLDGLENSLSTSPYLDDGRYTICWHGAIDCYRNAKY